MPTRCPFTVRSRIESGSDDVEQRQSGSLTFSSADIEALPGGFFLFNVDDIVTAPADPPRRVAEGPSDLN